MAIFLARHALLFTRPFSCFPFRDACKCLQTQPEVGNEIKTKKQRSDVTGNTTTKTDGRGDRRHRKTSKNIKKPQQNESVLLLERGCACWNGINCQHSLITHLFVNCVSSPKQMHFARTTREQTTRDVDTCHAMCLRGFKDAVVATTVYAAVVSFGVMQARPTGL